MTNLIKNIATVITIVIVIDIIGYCAWSVSGQKPVDDFFIGGITASLLK
jgi:hypothetical protein